MKLPNERLTITGHEYALLKPGLDMLTNRLAGACKGFFPYQHWSARFETVLTDIYKCREYDKVMARKLISAAAKLVCTDSSRRVRLDEFEIAATALALRLLKFPGGPALAEAQEEASGRLLRKLEKCRKRAKVDTVAKLGREERMAVADRWKGFVAWVRYSLLQYKPNLQKNAAVASIRRKKLEGVKALIEDVVNKSFYEPLDNEEMKRIVRLFLVSATRLRQDTTLLEILKSPDAHRPKLLEFIQRRTALIKRADFPKPPWMRMMENADKFREYELARRNGTWKPPVPVLPAVPPPSASGTAKCKGVWRAPVPAQIRAEIEPYPHTPAWEERLWNFLGEWFSRDVPIDLRIPLMDRVSHLLKFDGHLGYRYVQVRFTTFPAVFAACKPYPEDTVLAWHAAWALRFLFALHRKPECMNTDLKEGAARALIAEGIHNG